MNEKKLREIEDSIDEPIEKIQKILDKLTDALYVDKDLGITRKEELKIEDAICHVDESIFHLKKAQDYILGGQFTTQKGVLMYQSELHRLARVARLIDELVDNTICAINHAEERLSEIEDMDCERYDRIETLLCYLEDVVPNLEKAEKAIVKALDAYERRNK